MNPLPLSFFRRPAEVVARDLLGATIVSSIGGVRTTGIITETEAYLGFDDPASHAYRGRRTLHNASLYAPQGTWYVYRSYGIHWCANLVAGDSGAGAAVLLRGVSPRSGVALMRRRRGPVPDRRLADGPGKLCQAFGITRQVDGCLMRRSSLLVGRSSRWGAGSIRITPRLGISRAVSWPLRFVTDAPAA